GFEVAGAEIVEQLVHVVERARIGDCVRGIARVEQGRREVLQVEASRELGVDAAVPLREPGGQHVETVLVAFEPRRRHTTPSRRAHSTTCARTSASPSTAPSRMRTQPPTTVVSMTAPEAAYTRLSRT